MSYAGDSGWAETIFLSLYIVYLIPESAKMSNLFYACYYFMNGKISDFEYKNKFICEELSERVRGRQK